MARRFTVDRDFEKDLLRSVGVRAMLEAKVKRGAEIARDLAPDDPATSAPDLRSSIEGNVVERDGQLVGEIRATDWKWHLWEFGHGGRAKPFLRPAAEQVLDGPLLDDRKG